MAKVQFKRIESSSSINDVPVLDGQIIYTKDGKTYLDYEGQRVVVNGTPDTTMSDSSTNAIANSTVKSYIDTNIATVNSNIHNGTILWSNSNPTSNFTTQNITLSSSDYDVLEFYVKSSTAGTDIYTVKTIKGYGVVAETITELNEGYSQYTGFRQRHINYTDDTHYSVANCLTRKNTNQSTQPEVENDKLIPLYVVGYKTGLFN